MTRVGNTEQIMALVRNQLQRMAKRERSNKSTQVNKSTNKQLSQRERLQALSSIEDLSEEEFTYGFVRGLLSDEFGTKVSNSPAFKQVVEKTAKAMQEDPEVAALIRQLRSEL